MQADAGPLPQFEDLLVSIPPRERSGSRSSNRFAFQHSWALGLTLRLHESTEDYCVLFDVHDDVVTLNHSSQPTKGRFFQVKTKSTGNWTLHQLTQREEGKNGPLPSIIGKLYDHYRRFGLNVEKMAIVSNAHFDVKVRCEPGSKERDTLCLEELEAEELAALSNKLIAEHQLVSDPEGLDRTYLDTTSLSLIDHVTHTEGVVSDFLSRQGDGTIHPRPFHRTLRSEIQRRNDRECSPITFDDLIKSKGLTRALLQSMIDSIPSAKTNDDLVASIRTQLSTEGITLRRHNDLVSQVRSFLAKRLDQTNLVLVDAVRQAQTAVAALPPSVLNSLRPLSDAAACLSSMQIANWSIIREQYSDLFLEALIMVTVYEQGISSPGAQPEEEIS